MLCSGGGWLQLVAWPCRLALPLVRCLRELHSLELLAQDPLLPHPAAMSQCRPRFGSPRCRPGYVRLSRKLRAFLEAPNLDVAPKIRRSDVITMLERVRLAS